MSGMMFHVEHLTVLLRFGNVCHYSLPDRNGWIKTTPLTKARLTHP